MNCQYCNATVSEDDEFCPSCGKKILAEKESKAHFFHFNGVGIKNTVLSWIYGAWKLWKKNPVFLLGMGLVLMALTLIPGLNVLALLLSGAILGLVFSSLEMIDKGEIPSLDKLFATLENLWVYLILVQLIALIVISFASIFYWIPALFVAALFLFIIPITVDKPTTIAEIFEKSYYLARNNYASVFTAIALITLINVAIFFLLPILLFFSIPYSLCMVYVSFLSLDTVPDEVKSTPPQPYAS